MERMANPHGIKFEHQHMVARRRCTICNRKLEQKAYYLTEGDDAPEPQQAWLLCAGCNTAVQVELARTELHSPVRTRVAVGMVASARSPGNRAKWWEERFWEDLDDHSYTRLLWWFFMIVAFGHMIVFLFLLMIPYIFHIH